MSPRGFKLGLALFLAMSGLFAAKLAIPAPGSLGAGIAASWQKAKEAVATAPAGPPAPSQQASAPTSHPEAAAPRAVPDEAAAVKAAESAAHVAPPLSESDASLVSAIKLELKSRGYDIGTASALDLQARAGIMAFESDNDMRLTGEASQALLHRLLLGATGAEANSSSPPAPRAEDVIRAVQTSLKDAGHPDQKVDGQLTRETVETIRTFERARNLKVSGRISGELVAELQRVARHGPLAAR